MSAATFVLRHLGRLPMPIGQQRPVVAQRHHLEQPAAVADLVATLAIARPGELVILEARVAS